MTGNDVTRQGGLRVPVPKLEQTAGNNWSLWMSEAKRWRHYFHRGDFHFQHSKVYIIYMYIMYCIYIKINLHKRESVLDKQNFPFSSSSDFTQTKTNVILKVINLLCSISISKTRYKKRRGSIIMMKSLTERQLPNHTTASSHFLQSWYSA